MHCLFCVPMRHFIVVTMCLNFGHFLSCIKFVTCAFNNSHMNIVNYFSPFVCQLHLLCYLFNYKVHTLKEKLKFTTYKSDWFLITLDICKHKALICIKQIAQHNRNKFVPPTKNKRDDQFMCFCHYNIYVLWKMAHYAITLHIKSII